MIENLDKLTISTSQLAKIFNVTEKYLSELHRENGLPKIGHDEWSLIDCVCWRFNYLEKVFENRLEKASSQKASDRLSNKSAELKDLIIKEKQNQLLDRIDTFNKVTELLNVIINSLDGFGLKNAPLIIGKKDIIEVADILNNSINQIKEKIATTKFEMDLSQESE